MVQSSINANKLTQNNKKTYFLKEKHLYVKSYRKEPSSPTKITLIIYRLRILTHISDKLHYNTHDD